ncbi:DNA repair protein rad52 [Dipsacomyces acuminosporus]|nr:DNA repair protein rad52 [Dipsacomyces acuminosporus]
MSQYPTQAAASSGDMSFPVNFTDDQATYIQDQLRKKLGPENVSTRRGPGNTSLSYIEGWRVISIANQIFGFNGWRSSIQNLSIDFMDVNSNNGAVSIGASCLLRITLRDGTYKEDIGYGMVENSKSKGQAFEKVKKEAVTDAIKRAMRQFGNALGNCVYDKDYLRNVKQVRAEPKEKITGEFLFRGSALEQTQSGLAQTPTRGTSVAAVPGNHAQAAGHSTGNTAGGLAQSGADSSFIDVDDMVDEAMFTMMDDLEMERPIIADSPSMAYAIPATPQPMNQGQHLQQQQQQQTPRNPGNGNANNRRTPSSSMLSANSPDSATPSNPNSARRLNFPPPHNRLANASSPAPGNGITANSTPAREPSQWPRSFADATGFSPATQLNDPRGTRRQSTESIEVGETLHNNLPKKHRHID